MNWLLKLGVGAVVRTYCKKKSIQGRDTGGSRDSTGCTLTMFSTVQRHRRVEPGHTNHTVVGLIWVHVGQVKFIHMYTEAYRSVLACSREPRRDAAATHLFFWVLTLSTDADSVALRAPRASVRSLHAHTAFAHGIDESAQVLSSTWYPESTHASPFVSLTTVGFSRVPFRSRARAAVDQSASLLSTVHHFALHCHVTAQS